MRRSCLVISTATLTLALGGSLSAAAPAAGAESSRPFPRTIHSQPAAGRDQTHALPRGHHLSARDVTQIVSLSSTVRAGLGDRGSVMGNVYPVISNDQGKHWRIDGPRFFDATAAGPDETSRLKALGSRTLIAWGHGGNLVKTTRDRGKHWRTADFPGGIESAGASDGHVVTRALGNEGKDGKFATRRYTLSDQGRVWRRGKKLPSVKH